MRFFMANRSVSFCSTIHLYEGCAQQLGDNKKGCTQTQINTEDLNEIIVQYLRIELGGSPSIGLNTSIDHEKCEFL